jgi:glycosyltransferase involved in cell wall biosynthesis
VLRAPREMESALAFDFFCPSVRMGLQTAVALESVALLRSVHTDACLPPGRAARVLERVAGPRVANRVVGGIPAERIHRHPQLAVASRVRRRLLMSGQDPTAVYRVTLRMYSSIARQCGSQAVVGTQGSCLELFEDRTYRIMEQIAAPHRYDQAVAVEELARFPGWAPEGVTRSSPWDHRTEAEWQAADLIWVPSPHLIGNSKEFGADPLKFHVIPFPIPRPQPAGAIRNFGGRRLRVIFAGTLMFRKGVQYIYEALHKRPDLPVQMEFFGPVNLTPTGVRHLAQVGTVHGAVPRSRLLEEFCSADVLLFPSLSEGSALVTLEATALGLPVVATEETGAPASAMVIPSRSPEAIIEAIEALADDPARLERLSAAGLAEASKRSLAMYANDIAGSTERLTGCGGESRIIQ